MVDFQQAFAFAPFPAWQRSCMELKTSSGESCWNFQVPMAYVSNNFKTVRPTIIKQPLLKIHALILLLKTKLQTIANPMKSLKFASSFSPRYKLGHTELLAAIGELPSDRSPWVILSRIQFAWPKQRRCLRRDKGEWTPCGCCFFSFGFASIRNYDVNIDQNNQNYYRV